MIKLNIQNWDNFMRLFQNKKTSPSGFYRIGITLNNDKPQIAFFKVLNESLSELKISNKIINIITNSFNYDLQFIEKAKVEKFTFFSDNEEIITINNVF